MSRVFINQGVLRWALDRSRLTESELEHKFPKIREWIGGKSQPTLKQLEALAKTTLTPLGFFFLKKPPDDSLPVPYFRTGNLNVPSRTSPDLLETIRIMQLRQSWLQEYLIEQGQPRVPFVSSARLEENPAAIAERMRLILGLDHEWAAHQPTWTEALRILREAIEAAGILVVVNGIVGNNTHRKLDPNEFRGFVLVDDFAPLMFVNNADAKAAQMFTLMHELAHVFLGSSAAFDLREMLPAEDRTEQACNRAAAEFLIPENALRQLWPSVKKDPNPFQTIARQFKISSIVAARRALDLNLIDKENFFKFYRDYIKNLPPPHKSAGGDNNLNQNLRVGRRFATAVVWAAREGKLLYSEAYKLTGLYGKSFDSYASYLGIGGP